MVIDNPVEFTKTVEQNLQQLDITSAHHLNNTLVNAIREATETHSPKPLKRSEKFNEMIKQ